MRRTLDTPEETNTARGGVTAIVALGVLLVGSALSIREILSVGADRVALRAMGDRTHFAQSEFPRQSIERR